MKTVKTAEGTTFEGVVDGQFHKVFVPVVLSPETPPTHHISLDGKKWHEMGNGNYRRIIKKMQ